MVNPITENQVESFSIESLLSQGWIYAHGLTIAPEGKKSERESFEQIPLLQKMMSNEVRVKDQDIGEKNAQ